MSNKHVNHQHGLVTMNSSRPKTSLRKRANKAKAKARKLPLLQALFEARYGAKKVAVKKARPTTRKKTVKTDSKVKASSAKKKASKKKAD